MFAGAQVVGLSLQKQEDKEPALVSDKERVQWVGLDKELQDMVLQVEGKYNLLEELN